MNQLKVRSCLIDGEAVACDANGLAVFEHLRRKPTGRHVLLYAVDLLELDGEDLRRAAFETRKAIDPDRHEDVMTDSEDHACDEWRYACMSRPWVPMKEGPKPENISGYRLYRMDAQPGDWLTY